MITTLRQSTKAKFEQCPKAFYYRHVEGLPDPPGIDAVRGTIVHTALERLFQEPSGARTREAAQNALEEAYGEATLGSDYLSIPFEDADDELGFWHECGWLVDNLFDMEDPNAARIYHLEYTLGGEVGGVPLRGTIDRIDYHADGIRIIDYKSGKTPAKKYQAKALNQLYIYAALLAEVGQFEPREVALYYLRGKEIISAPVTEKHLISTRLNLVMAWNDIATAEATDDYPTKVGPLCNWCNFQPICPAWLGEDGE